MQRAVLAAHSDLYRPHDSYPVVRVQQGKVSTQSVVAAPFGYAIEIEPAEFTRSRSGMRTSIADTISCRDGVPRNSPDRGRMSVQSVGVIPIQGIIWAECREQAGPS